MRPRVLLVLGALVLTMLMPGTVGARSAQAGAKAEHDRIVAYWTPARIAAAKWKNFDRDSSGKFNPSKGKPPTSGGTVRGASWTGNGEIEKRSGRILFSTVAGDWICSGSVVNDGTGNGQSIVLTAGHCVYDGSEGWSFNFMYIPDFDDAPTYTCANTVYGCWTATRLAANSTFVSGGGFGTNQTVAVDYGFARVGTGGKNNLELDSVTSGYDLNTAALSNNEVKWAFGYPAAGKYHGSDLVYCKGPTINDPNGAATWGIACDMTGGSSGGPWIWNTTNPAQYTTATKLTSVNSYGYSGLTYMFGPKFNGATATVAGDAGDGTQTNGTSIVHAIP
jgi:V8-like Glu-specific endopeptidase